MAQDELDKLCEKWNVKPVKVWQDLELKLDVLETGILPLDMGFGALGPDGRMGIRARSVVELLGPPSVGKSSALVQIIKTTLDRYGRGSVVGIYAEPPDIHTFLDKGVDIDDVLARFVYDENLALSKNLFEEQLDSMLAFCKRPQTRLIFIDSLGAALGAGDLFENESKGINRSVEDIPQIASTASVFKRFMLQFQKLNINSTLIYTNHYTKQIKASKYDPQIVPLDQLESNGGLKKDYFATHRVLIRGTKIWDEENHSVEGTRRAEAIKNTFEIFKRKLGAPRTVLAELDLRTGKYNNEIKLIEYANFFGTRKKTKNEKGKEEIVTVSELDPPLAINGSWTYIGDRSFNGKENALQYFKENPEMYDKLRYQLYQRADRFFADDKEVDAGQELDG